MTVLSDRLRDEIEAHLINKIDKKLADYRKETNSAPFLERLLGADRIVNHSLVHSISTSLGASVYEQIAVIIVNANPRIAEVERQHKLVGHIGSDTILLIDTIIQGLITSTREPNFKNEAKEIFNSISKTNLGEKRSVKVDLFIRMANGSEFFFDVKTVKPNKDNAESNKKKILTWLALRMSQESCNEKLTNLISAAIALPYNPYEPQPYNRWTTRIVHEYGKDLLVGNDFWDLLGGEGTYIELLEVFQDTGLKKHHEIEHQLNQIVIKSAVQSKLN